MSIVNSVGRNSAIILDFVKHVLNEDEKPVFNRIFCETLALGGIEAMLLAPTAKQLKHCLITSLQQLADQATKPSRACQLWNPINAFFINRYFDESPSAANDKPQNIPQNKPSSQTVVTKVTPPKRKNGADPPKTSDKVGTFASTLKKSKSEANLSKKSLVQGTPKREPIPASKEQKSTSETTVAETTTKNEQVPVEVQTYLRAYAETKTRDLCLFHCNPWMKKKCSVKNCSFCKSVFYEIDITKCGTDSKYSCTAEKPCVSLGWFPHVGKSLSEIIHKFHNKGRLYKSKKGTTSLSFYYKVNEELSDSFSKLGEPSRPLLIPAKLTTKRKSTDMDVSEPVKRVPKPGAELLCQAFQEHIEDEAVLSPPPSSSDEQ